MEQKRRSKIKHPKNAGKGKTFTREKVLDDLELMLKNMAVKICHGRIRDKEAFKLKLLALKAFAYSASVYSSVLDAVENEAIMSRLSILEDGVLGDKHHDKGKTEE